MDETVRSQYETYPYPLRDPADDMRNMGLSPLEDLRVVNHYCFAGRRDWQKPFRVLVAGGGTGDASTMLGRQLKDIGCGGEVVYLDLSEASQVVARERAEAAGLDNVTFLQGSLLDVGGMDVGSFDYINCSGVLHHLEDPEEGARSLATVLKDEGAMGIMLYGEVGRTGVYHAQEMLRLLQGERDHVEQVALAKKLLSQLPHSNWLVKNQEIRFTDQLDDAEIFDRFLHSCDKPYRVSSAVELMDAVGMNVVDFVPSLLYQPGTFLQDEELLADLWQLPAFQQYAFTELYVGVISKLSFFAVSDSDPVLRTADPYQPENVPILLPMTGIKLADMIQETNALSMSLGAIEFTQPLRLAPDVDAMVRSMDGRTSLQGMFEELSPKYGLDWESFHSGFLALYHLLNGASCLVLGAADSHAEEAD